MGPVYLIKFHLFRTEGEWKINLSHSGSDGWLGEKVWITFESGVNLVCSIDEWLDDDESFEKNCSLSY